MAANIRFATEADIPVILEFIHALAAYENMEDQVIVTPELLKEWVFQKKKAEVFLVSEDEKPVGFALFFHNFSTWLGRAGIYLEDLFVLPEYRGKGYGKLLLKRLARLCFTAPVAADWKGVPSIGTPQAASSRFPRLPCCMEEWTTYRRRVMHFCPLRPTSHSNNFAKAKRRAAARLFLSVLRLAFMQESVV